MSAMSDRVWRDYFIEPAERETRRAPKGRTCPQNMRNLYIKLYIYIYMCIYVDKYTYVCIFKKYIYIYIYIYIRIFMTDPTYADVRN